MALITLPNAEYRIDTSGFQNYRFTTSSTDHVALPAAD